MEEGISRKQVKISDVFKTNRKHVYDYTVETFGYFQAERYLQLVEKVLSTLYSFYTAYPECRHLATKSRIYRTGADPIYTSF